jgi:hypothetical protein
MEKPVCGPEALLLMSSNPTVMFPAPSAVMLPAICIPPAEPPPPIKKAYCPFSSPSWPEGQVTEREWVIVRTKDADFDVSATAVAVAVTMKPAGTKSGAV